MGSATSECLSCGSEDEAAECPKSKRLCRHHCNCSWTMDECCWCGKVFGEVKPKRSRRSRKAGK